GGLGPPAGTTGIEPNGRSVVLEIETSGERLVLAGDADTASEAVWASRAAAPLTALKLGHHGSHTSSAGATLDALRPRLVLISCGANNRFGHPHTDVLERLAERHIPSWRTDRQGTLALDLGLRGAAPEPVRLLPRPPSE